jgi:arsenate reductase
VHPAAVEVMRELGIDISGQRPKRIDEVPLGDVDLIVTLCAENVCPATPPSTRRESWPLPDPAAAGDNGAGAEAFRRVRDDLRERLQRLATGWIESRPAVTPR